MAKRAKPGDVVEVVAPAGVIYLQYVGKHSKYGACVLVCPRIQASQRPNPQLFVDGYFTFYPLNAALRQGLASICGHLPPRAIPDRFRRPGVICDRRVETWIIEDASGDHLRHHLSDGELQLPIAAIWNHEFLIERVTKGWRPEMEGVTAHKPRVPTQSPSPTTPISDGDQTTNGDKEVLKALAHASDPLAPHRILHYLYFSSRSRASSVTKQLRGQGFLVEERLGADGINWLVLAQHTLVPTEATIANARKVMEDLAQSNEGEYDGWEAEVQKLGGPPKR